MADDEDDTDDTEDEDGEVAVAERPTAAPVRKAEAPKGKDEDPFGLGAGYEVKDAPKGTKGEPAKAEAKGGDPFGLGDGYEVSDEPKKKPKGGESWEITKAFRHGIGGTAQTAAAAVRAAGYELGDTEKEAREGVVQGGLEKLGKWASGDQDIRVQSVADIHGVGDAFDFVMQNIGQAVGSSLAPMLTGAAGAYAGSAVPVVGTVVGGVIGAGASSMPLGIGTMFQALEDDKEIQKLVKEGKTTWKDLAEASVPYGLAIGSLDLMGEAALAKIAGLHNIGKTEAKELVKEQIKQGLIKRIAIGAAKGKITEGTTEGAQQGLQEYGRIQLGGDPDLDKARMAILDAAIGGAIGGAATGAAGGAFHKEKGKAKGENEEGSPESGAQDQKPGMTGTGAPHDEDPSTSAAGQSTPGGAAPAPPAQPAGNATKQTETAPPSGTPPTGEGKAAPPAQPPPTGGVADPSLAAGLKSAVGTEEDEGDLTAEQEAKVAARKPTQGVTDPDAALALQEIAPALDAPQAPAGAAPQPAAEQPAAPAAMPPAGPPPEGVAPTPGVPPPAPVQQAPAEAPVSPVAGAEAQAVPTPTPVGPGATAEAVPGQAQATAPPQTVPEAPATLEAQRQQLANGERKAVMYPKGTKPGKLPKGMAATVVKGDVYHFNPGQILKEEVRNAAKEGRQNELLGLGPFNKEEVMATPGPEMAVAERTPEGVEVRAAGATPTTAPVQQAAMEAGKTPGNIVAPEPIDQTLAARVAEAPAPAHPESTLVKAPKGEAIKKKAKAREEKKAAPAPEPAPAPPPPTPKQRREAQQAKARAEVAPTVEAMKADLEEIKEKAPAPKAPEPAASEPLQTKETVTEKKPALKAPAEVKELRQKEQAEAAAEPAMVHGAAKKAPVVQVAKRRGVGPKTQAVIAKTQAVTVTPEQTRERGLSDLREHVRSLLPAVQKIEKTQSIAEDLEKGGTEAKESIEEAHNVEHTARENTLNELMEDIGKEFEEHAGSVRGFVDDAKKKLNKGIVAHVYEKHVSNVEEQRRQEAEKAAEEEAHRVVEQHRALQEEDEARAKGERDVRDKGRVTAQTPFDIHPEDARNRSLNAFIAMVRGVAETATKKEIALPEVFQKAADAIEAVRTKRGKARDPYNSRIEAARKEWVAAVEKNAQEKEAQAAPKPTKEEEVAVQKEIAELAAEEKEMLTDEAKISRAIEKGSADPLNAQAQSAIEKHLPQEVLVSGDAERILAAAQEAVKEYGEELPDKALYTNPPWVNFLRSIAKRKRLSYDAQGNLLIGYSYLKEGKPKDYYEFVNGTKDAHGLQVDDYLREFHGEGQEKGTVEAGRSTGKRTQVTDSDFAIVAKMPAMRWKKREGAPKKGKQPRRVEVTGNRVVNGATGNYITLHPSQEMTAAKAMERAVPTKGKGFKGILGLINKTVSAELTKLVGDVRVHIVPHDHIMHLLGDTAPEGGVDGVYFPASLEQAAKGDKGIILIVGEGVNKDGTFTERLSRVLRHEMVHAATEHAYNTNYKGTKDIIDALHVEARAMHEAVTGQNPDEVYGLTDPYEYMAEGMSNPQFQKLLMKMPVSSATERKVRALGRGEKVTAWRLFVAHVANIIKAAWAGEKGMSATEALMRTFEHMSRDDAAQREHYGKFSHWDSYRQGNPIVVMGPKGQAAIAAAIASGKGMTPETFFEHAASRLSIADTARDTYDALHARAAHDGTSWARVFRDKFLSNTTDIQRRLERLVGPDHPIVKAMKAFLSTDAKRNELQRKGDVIAVKLDNFIRKFPEAGKKLIDLLHASTRAGVDFTQDETHANNKYFNNQQSKFIRQRREHQELHDAFKKLAAGKEHGTEVQALAHEMAGYYTGRQDEMVTATVKRILETALKHQAVTLPQGETIDTITQWVKSGDIDKGVKKQSDRDKALHKALPNVMNRLQDASEIREARGIYAPLARQGDFAVTGWKDLEKFEKWVPEDQQEAGKDYLPKGAEATARDELYFGDEKDYENYARTTNDQWKADPRIKKKGGFSAFVKVQKDHLSFHESKYEAERARKDLIDSGEYRTHAEAEHNQISQVMHRKDQTQDQFQHELLPEHVKALLNSMKQSGLKDAAYETAKQGVVNTYIQSMAGNRAAHHKLRRKFTAGESRDVVRAMRSYNMATSSYLANMEQMPTIQEGLDKMQADLDAHPGDPDYIRKQEGMDEFKRRVNDTGTYRNHGLLRTFTNISYLNHLASPAFLAMQYLQPLYSTFPALAGHYGGGKSTAAIFSAMRRMGAGATYLEGWKKAGATAIGKEAAETDGFRGSKKLTATDQKVIAEMQRRGLLDAEAGQEDALRRLSDNPVERFLGPINTIMKHLTGSIEDVNRVATGIAAAELAMKHAGMTEEQAIEHAMNMVEQTQYNYGSANAPPILNHPLARVTLQFKKYAIGLGNYMARQIYHGFRMGKNMTETQKLERRQALKSMAYMFGTYAMFSGLSGSLPWELVKGPLMMIGWLTGHGEWGKTDEFMSTLQKLAAGAFGKQTAEVLMRGLPRLIGLDLSGRINISSLAMFGDPKDPKKTDSIKAWLFDLFSGAPVSMVMNAIDAMQKSDFSSPGAAAKSLIEAAPLPKFIKDVEKAWKGGTEGSITTGGKQTAKPMGMSDVVWKSLGFRTAKEAENWEPGGGGYQYQQEQEAKQAKSAIMAPWHKADALKDPDAKKAAWVKIQAWNKDNPKQRISMDDLIKAKNRKAADAAKEKRALATQ